jgi:Na+-driven multidrug efflux pump
MISLFWVLTGLVLTVLGMTGVIDSYWCGMGGGLIGAGAVQTYRFYRYHKDAEYREEMDIQNQDERNHFISGKAWSWAGYLTIIVAAVASIALRALKYNEYSMIASLFVCIILVAYWISYWVLNKKY